ncbi:MAG: EH signature domain-containing protein [Rikenellaceae bacterium]
MDALKSIFGIDLDMDLYMRSANTIVPIHLESKINKRCEANRLAVEKFEASDVYEPKILDIADIRERFLLYCESPDTETDFTNIELKKMSYFSNEIASSAEEYYLLIRLFEENWRDSYLNGFIFFLLSRWDILENDLESKHFRDYAIEKIETYDGSKNRLLKAKQGVIYLKDGGATKLGQKLKTDKIKIIDAPQVLGQKDSALVFPYFSKVIQAYYYKDYLNYEDLDDSLTIHSSSLTSKIVLADKINYVGRMNLVEQMDTLKSLALEHIGDPATKAKWSVSGVDDEIVSKVEKAHENVNRWMIQMYINVVFSTMIEDPRRREFWLNYVDHITSFKVIGSQLNKQKLASSPLLKDSLKYYFKQTLDERTKSTCSMLIAIKDHYFIEFSDLGSLYVYDASDKRISNLLRGNIYKIEDLKTPGWHNLVEPGYYCDHYNNDGKMVHRGTWESRLKSWFKDKLELDVNKKVYRRRG